MYRAKRMMPDEEAKAFLRTHKIAHVGTVDANGWPYVVPLIYIYEQGDFLYLHTGDHQGHFLTNIQHHPRICVEVGKIGAVHRDKPYACNSALVYSSVIVFGAVRLIDDRALKTWFFDRIWAKYGEEGWTFEPGYPQLNRSILYEQRIAVATGKQSQVFITERFAEGHLNLACKEVNVRKSEGESDMPESIYPPSSQDLARKRRELAPNIQSAFEAFSKSVFADGALPAKTKQLIAVAAAHITQCPYCIKSHTKAATLKRGATPQEIMEAIWVAAEMRAGGAYAHSTISLTTMNEEQQRHER